MKKWWIALGITAMMLFAAIGCTGPTIGEEQNSPSPSSQMPENNSGTDEEATPQPGYQTPGPFDSSHPGEIETDEDGADEEEATPQPGYQTPGPFDSSHPAEVDPQSDTDDVQTTPQPGYQTPGPFDSSHPDESTNDQEN